MQHVSLIYKSSMLFWLEQVVPTAANHNQTTLVLLFVFTVVIISLVLLNMLIAIMTSIFEEAEEQAEAKMCEYFTALSHPEQ